MGKKMPRACQRREKEMGEEREEMGKKMRNGRLDEDALTGKCSQRTSLREEEPLWLFAELLGYKIISLSREAPAFSHLRPRAAPVSFAGERIWEGMQYCLSLR
jgi:hypothetical protein